MAILLTTCIATLHHFLLCNLYFLWERQKAAKGMDSQGIWIRIHRLRVAKLCMAILLVLLLRNFSIN